VLGALGLLEGLDDLNEAIKYTLKQGQNINYIFLAFESLSQEILLW